MVDSWRGLLAALVVIFLSTLAVMLPLGLLSTTFSSVPFVITTWPYANATQIAWDVVDNGGNALDALEAGCNFCELNPGDCQYNVGHGSEPDEHGEVTLDAMIIDGATHEVGAVGCLRRVKKAISVARHVMDYTKHTLLVGDLAKQFAVEMGFKEESLSTDRSQEQYEEWRNNNCQPNFRQNVLPDPTKSCGPYNPITKSKFWASPHQRKSRNDIKWKRVIGGQDDHDTIGMVVIDGDSNIAAGTSTNGLTHKIPGRVGDSPIIGAGAYAENGVGGAAATGNGDIMMRFLPSYQAVESMRSGVPPDKAARLALRRITRVYTDFAGAIVAANSKGEYGVACVGDTTFPFYIHSEKDGNTKLVVECDND